METFTTINPTPPLSITHTWHQVTDGGVGGEVETFTTIKPTPPLSITHTWHQVADGGVGSEVEIFTDVPLKKHVSEDPLCFVTQDPRGFDILDPQGGRVLAVPSIQHFGGGHTLVGGSSIVQNLDDVLTQSGHIPFLCRSCARRMICDGSK